jgi:hypothetical protein
MSSSNINFIIFIYLYMRQQQQTTFLQSLTSAERQKLHSHYAKRYYKSLSIRERRNRSRWVPRRALQDPQYSAWQKLLSSNDDQSLITLTGFNCQTFDLRHTTIRILHMLINRAQLYQSLIMDMGARD